MQTKKRALAISLILAALVFAGALISHLSPNSALGAEETVPLTTAAPGPLVVDNPYLIADIAELASPATVFISVEWPLPEQNEQRTAPQDPFSFFLIIGLPIPFSASPPAPRPPAPVRVSSLTKRGSSSPTNMWWAAEARNK